MRVLFHHRIASRDGQAVHIEELITALARQGHQTFLVGPPSLSSTGFGQSNRAIAQLKRFVPTILYELLEIAYNLKAFLRLRAAVKTYQPDVIYERFSLFLFAGVWARRIYGIPLLLEVNSPLYEERAANDGLGLHRFGRWAQRFIWNRADHVLPVTGVLARMILECGVPDSRVTVIPNGVDPERFGSAPEPEAAKIALRLPLRVILGFTGFIRGWNAIHRLIEFVASHREDMDLQILVVGDGPARRSLEEYACAQGVSDRLTITGVVERGDVAGHIAAFDIAVIPGLTPYSSPLKLFEYLQLGRAIVAPNTENIREILTDEQDALLFDPDKGGDLECKLIRLYSDPVLRDRLGRAARATIVGKSLTWAHNAREVSSIARTLVSQALPRYRRSTKDLDVISPN